MQTAKISKQGSEWHVIHAGGVEKFKDATAAIERANAINEQAEQAAAASGPRVQLLSKDGAPVNGIPTVKATGAVVFTSTDKRTGAKKATTEIDLCEIAGYVLVSRNGSGNVRAEWGNPPDFGRYAPISAAGIDALRSLLTPKTT